MVKLSGVTKLLSKIISRREGNDCWGSENRYIEKDPWKYKENLDQVSTPSSDCHTPHMCISGCI